MQRWLLALIIMAAGLIPAAGSAEQAVKKTARIGAADVVITAPSGFAFVGEELPAVLKIMEATTPPFNLLLAGLVSEADHAAFLAGGERPLTRYLYVQVARQTIDVNVDASLFAKTAAFIRDQNTKLFDEFKKRMPGLIDDVSGRLGHAIDKEVRLKIPDMTLLPPHGETKQTFAFSMYIRLKGEVVGVSGIDTLLAATATFVHVRGKILFLYAYGAENDLEWTRAISAEWADAIVAANP